MTTCYMDARESVEKAIRIFQSLQFAECGAKFDEKFEEMLDALTDLSEELFQAHCDAIEEDQ